ncbi:NAD-glutamate dehydrogenase [Cognatilysobacter lacus]|uniref:NAD-glutamate dehydrogenase n=1 Tax=Cognatilysobacter lacus TaxID=1643323 RepID=A0A5D8ZA64_9GAMM|nr:NAD-glutamate dehydrogenase domain-containing protein [Lysobacter lacus]TZF91012.1 NAD-glutamate dehydrogenase [Lysobacter lacus]
MTTKRTPAAKARASERDDSAAVEQIIAALHAKLPKAQQALSEAFARTFYKRMTSDEFPQHAPEAWASLAAEFVDFFRTRKPGTPLVRLFNPTMKANGWESVHTVLQVANDDMPFLVDSVTLALAERGIAVHVLGHPVLRIQRDRAGKLTGVGEGAPESLMHLEIDRQSADDMAAIEAAIRHVLQDVRAIVVDWEAMRDRMREVAEQLGERPCPLAKQDVVESQEFLRWAAENHFTFLGYREYEVRKQGRQDVLQAIPGTGLGLLRGEERGQPRPVTSLGAHSPDGSVVPDVLILTKTNARATVHRRGYMDYIGVLSFDKTGKPIREERFLGLFTSSAYNRRPWDIPVVRRRYEHVMQQSGLPEDGHSGKALKHILESLPRDELFQASEADLLTTSMGVLGLQERVRSRIFMRRDRYGRFYSALVYIPRDRFNTEVRLRIEAMLKEALNADHVDSAVQLGESPLAQLHIMVRPKPTDGHSGTVPDVDVGAIETQLARIVRNWTDDLRDLLITRHGEQSGLPLANAYGRALPAGYIENVSAQVAADDVDNLAALSGPDDLRLSLYRNQSTGGLRFKFYRQGDDIPLSDALPMMENMGLRVISEHPYRIEAAGRVLFIQDFEVEYGRALDVTEFDVDFEEAFAAIWRGQAENDGFNRLILAAGLSWKQVAMLRAYCKYLLQVGVAFSQTYMESTLARYPLLARLLVELFEARFDPATGRESKTEIQAGMLKFHAQLGRLASGDAALVAAVQPVIEARAGKRDGQVQAARAALLGLMDRVSSLDEDRILRSFRGAIEATLRTSYYQGSHGGADTGYVSYKFDSSKVPDLPKPVPYREIFVYGARVEGVHLRFGPVARGGLRWSDRREDFRTEVLGLVKAQMVKNTVIVPVGSKGGFYVKRPPAGGDRDAVQAEGIACYSMFINGLLDITDNIVDGKIVAPADVVRYDDDDPYLVVAADKGTATFSDIANGIAREHGFWLDDAFASGGSVGYDHKGMGITARGAWESVKRHFRAMGRDSQKQDFTVVGIGDMSGDVFGNGMLLSKHILLIAAFDHRHIFLDPTPDAAVSFKERARMFKLPRSSWEDYNTRLISKGGGIYPRSAKSIPLSPQIRQALGVDAAIEAMSPAELMSAILKAPVDLLWNGGIGTYVKSSRETHADVGDRANNALRVDGRDLRCRVVGEGGNLGLTQLGRIEAAHHGVLLNTDFIDNSAGVDTSDHEVNIKILLNAAVQQKKLSFDARNTLLASMTDEVGDLVLTDNYRQNQALSVMERMSVTRLGSKQHFIRTLESQGLLDRQIEFLPSDAEFAERKARGQGLTRPELSVLLSYSKLVLFPQLVQSDVPEDPYLSKELVRYFPKPLQEKYTKQMEGHRLKREIIATAVTNSMVNRMGATFVMRMQEDTGRSPAEIAKAYTIARESLQARDMWAQVDALDGKVEEAAQIDALLAIWQLMRSMTRWLLSRPGAIPAIEAAVARYGDGIRAVHEALPVAMTAEQRTAFDRRVVQWRGKGLPEALARQIAALPLFDAAMDIVEIAQARKLAPAEVTRAHFALSGALHIAWLYDQIEALPVESRWQALARGSLRDELGAQQRALVGQILADGGRKPVDGRVDAWLRRDDASLRFTLSMLAELASQKSLDYPTVSVAVRRLAQLASAG